MRRIFSIVVPAVILLTAAFYSVTITSCQNVLKNDTTIHNNGTTIQGHVYDYAGFPFPGVKVYSSPTNYTTTLRDGYFSLSNVSYPVTLIAKKDGDSAINVYQNLNANNPNLTCNTSNTENTNVVEGVFIIHYPVVSPDKAMLIQFACEDIIKFNYEYSVSDTMLARIPIKWQGDKQTLLGKLILMKYKRNPFDPFLITSYDTYAEKTFYIDTNRIINTTFYESDFTANPDEAVVNVRNNSYGISSDVNLYFSLAGNNNSDLRLDHLNYRGERDFIVPKIFPVNRIHVTAFNKYSAATDDNYVINNGFVLENSIITFPAIPEIALLNPALNAVDIDSTAIFTVNGNTSSTGVYLYNFTIEGNFFHSVYIYNASPTFTYPDLSGYGFNLRKGSNYKWTVKKMAPFGNLDDYCSAPTNKILKSYDTQANASYFMTKADTVITPKSQKLSK